MDQPETPFTLFAMHILSRRSSEGKFVPPPPHSDCTIILWRYQQLVAKSQGLRLKYLPLTRSIALAGARSKQGFMETVRAGYSPEQAWVNYHITFRRSRPHIRAMEAYGVSIRALQALDAYEQQVDSEGSVINFTPTESKLRIRSSELPASLPSAQIRTKQLAEAIRLIEIQLRVNVHTKDIPVVSEGYKQLKASDSSTSLPALIGRCVRAGDSVKLTEYRLFMIRFLQASRKYASSEISHPENKETSRFRRREASQLIEEIVRDSTTEEIKLAAAA